MPRSHRRHLLSRPNRAAGRTTLFRQEAGFLAFEGVLTEAHTRTSPRFLAYCVMPNHWHLLLWPREGRELSQGMLYLTAQYTERALGR